MPKSAPFPPRRDGHAGGKSARQSSRSLQRRKVALDSLTASFLCAREGMTLVPLKLYFNDRGMAKLQIGIAKGKKLADKRATEAKRDWQRQKARLMRERG